MLHSGLANHRGESLMRDRLFWWCMKRSKTARWFYRHLITEFLFDLEIQDIEDQKPKWIERLERLS
jgi:hypothetical protein